MNYRFSAACGCDAGRVRDSNEDNFLFEGVCLPAENGGLQSVLRARGELGGPRVFAVFDGMGGERCGEAAAFAAADALRSFRPEPGAQPREFLQSACDRMNLAVCAECGKLDYGRMGTTVCLLLLEGRRAHILNVGDSRLYLCRGGELLRLSEDHVERVTAAGSVKACLTQHLGIFPDELTLEPHIDMAELRTNDRFLLCSDGLTDAVDDGTLRRVVRGSSPAAAVRELTGLAKERGSKDNISAIVVRIF